MSEPLTTEDVRDAVIYASLGAGRGERAFWAWLAAHDAQVKAEALREAEREVRALNFGPTRPFTYASAHEWGKNAAADRLKYRIARIEKETP